MAFEQLDRYTDQLVTDWDRYEKLATEAHGKGDSKEADRWYFRQAQIVSDLGNYYLWVLKPTGKWKHQAGYCLAAIQKISPSYAEGMTSKPKRKQIAVKNGKEDKAA